MISRSSRVALGLFGAASAAVAVAQVAQNPGTKPAIPATTGSGPAAPGETSWAPPGTKGSPIIGEVFHAQVLLDAAGFSSGVIDGKKGMSLNQAVRGFQQSRGLDVTGKLDQPTRQALLQDARPSTVKIKLGPDDVKSTYIYPLPKDPEQQYKLPFLGYRNMLEKIAERYHTTPATVVALNGPQALIGLGQVLRLPNVVPASRDYSGTPGNGARAMSLLNVDARQPQGSYIVVDKSDGVLRVYSGDVPKDSGKKAASEDKSAPSDANKGQLVAQFPVTMGSTHDPLPIGDWKVTTFAFMPPFHYQPNLFWDAKDTSTDHMLPPGPNGPVGVAWLDLNKEHYGIHGTPEPSTIGRTESHGCIRMTNWDVMRLARMMKPGFSAKFEA